MTTPTEQYIKTLMRLKQGELGLLRAHSGQGLDRSVDGFDLFAGIWWPLRSKSQRAPRREVAWLVAKLYACCPVSQSRCATLASQLRQRSPSRDPEGRRFQERFDRMLTLPLDRIEPELRWAIARIASGGLTLDWVRLTDDLSGWERESVRLKWAEEFLGTDERR